MITPMGASLGTDNLLSRYELTRQLVTLHEQTLVVLRCQLEEDEARLDLATRPPASPIATAVLADAPRTRRVLPKGFDYRGRRYRCSTDIEIYLRLLALVIDDIPERVAYVVEALSRIGHTRTYLAKNRADLFMGRSAEWAARHSAEVARGWYADKNLSSAFIRRLIGVVLDAANLALDRDVAIRWSQRAMIDETGE